MRVNEVIDRVTLIQPGGAAASAGEYVGSWGVFGECSVLLRVETNLSVKRAFSIGDYQLTLQILTVYSLTL